MARIAAALAFSLALVQAEPAQAQIETPDPFVEHLEPTAGPPGTVVTLVGRHFRSDQVLSLGGVVMEVRERRPNRMTVVIPAGATSGHVIIRTADGELISGPELRVTEAPPPPTITSIAPTTATVGAEIHIVGTNFSSRVADDTVTLNGVSLVVHGASPTELVVVVPEGATTGPLVVRVAGAGEATSAPLTIESGLTIASFAPTTVAPGMELTITGTGFQARANRNRVTIGGVVARVRTASTTSLVVTVPATAVTGPIVVEPRGAGTVRTDASVVVRPMPTVTAIDPASAVPGASIRVRGTGFGTDIRAASASLGGTAMAVRAITDTELTLDVPASATASGPISVTIAGLPAVTSGGSLTVLVPVALTSFAPLSGPVGTEVTIVGVGFSTTPADDHVTLGGTACTVVSATATELRVRIPTATSGPLVVEVASNGTARTSQPFVITTPPTVASFEPVQGTAGTTVRITGTNFGTSTGLVEATVGGVRMEVRSVTPTSIEAVVPAAGVTGPIAVTIRLQGTATSSATFRVLGPFTVAADAVTGYPSQTVTLRGTGLASSTTVRFAGTTTDATTTRISSTELRAVVPEGATTGSITLHAEDGRELTVPFTLAADPTTAPAGIAEVVPTCTGRSCTIAIRGWGFGTSARALTVTIHGHRARVRSASPHFLEVTVPHAAGTGTAHLEIRGGAAVDSTEFAIE